MSAPHEPLHEPLHEPGEEYRGEAISEENTDGIAEGIFPGYPTPWVYDDPGRDVGPKQRDCWKPVIAAVQGMACGGAFYLLGEVEFIIAAEEATFFDPHQHSEGIDHVFVNGVARVRDGRIVDALPGRVLATR